MPHSFLTQKRIKSEAEKHNDNAEDSEMASRSEKWHVTKGIPAALIITLLGTMVIQTCAIVWWASNVSTRLNIVESRADLTIQVTRIESNVSYLSKSVDDVRSDVKTLLNKKSKD